MSEKTNEEIEDEIVKSFEGDPFDRLYKKLQEMLRGYVGSPMTPELLAIISYKLGDELKGTSFEGSAITLQRDGANHRIELEIDLSITRKQQ